VPGRVCAVGEGAVESGECFRGPPPSHTPQGRGNGVHRPLAGRRASEIGPPTVVFCRGELSSGLQVAGYKPGEEESWFFALDDDPEFGFLLHRSAVLGADIGLGRIDIAMSQLTLSISDGD